MNKEEKNKIVQEIVSSLFEDGRRYGESINYVTDDRLYEIRTNAIDNAIEQIDELLKDN